MTNRLLISVATAALIAGTGFANAQGTGTSREAPSAGSTAQQNAPPTAAEPAAPSSGTKATQTENSPGAVKNQRADENMPGQKSKGMSSETNDNGKAGSKDMKAEGREGRDGNMNPDAKNSDGKSASDNKAMDGKSQTTGQAGAGGKQLSSEQRTKITTVIKQQNIRPVTNVNFSVSVGTHVPRSVGFHPLPVEIVTIYPDWRGYEMFLVGDQLVIVNPRTLEIVAVIDA